MLAGLMVFAASGANASGGGGLPQLNPEVFAPQLFWLALAFGALYLIMSRVALPRIGEVIEERQMRMQRDLDEAERLKAETEKALAAYEVALAEARGKAHRIASEKRDALNAEVAQKRADVEQRITDKIAEAERRIVATKAGALSQVTDIAAETAQAIVEKLIGKQVKIDDVRKLVQSASKE